MKTLLFPGVAQLAKEHLDKFPTSHWKEKDYGEAKLEFDFNYVNIGSTSALYAFVMDALEKQGYRTVESLRLNIFAGHHFIQRHQDIHDTIVGYETMIILIESDGPRLVVDIDGKRTLIKEQVEQATLLDPMTFHEVLASNVKDDLRITICGWIK